MVAFFCPPPFMKSQVPFAASLEQYYYAVVTGTTQTVTINTGAPAAGRLIVVAVGYQFGGVINSATIGGVPATIVVNGIGTNNMGAILSAIVPTGSAASLVINSSASMNGGLSICSYRVVGYNSAVAFSSNASAGGGTAVRTATINTGLGGMAVAIGCGTNNGITSSISPFVLDDTNDNFDMGHVFNTPQVNGATFTHSGRVTMAASWR